jgi:predicted SnoaL-like aldol condensation-catalyzing enzyme
MNAEANKEFVRNHFEEFVNRKNLDIAEKNFAPEYQEHGSDAPPGQPPGPAGPKLYLAAAFKRFPDIHVTIEDIIGEGDKVVVRNTWRATDSTSGRKIQFSGIVIWRLAHGQLVERWAYLEAPHPVG